VDAVFISDVLHVVMARASDRKINWLKPKNASPTAIEMAWLPRPRPFTVGAFGRKPTTGKEFASPSAECQSEEGSMLFGDLFDRFLKESPLSVMSWATLEYALSASALDELFDRTAERGYTRELLFSTTVDLMSLVVGGQALHVKAAYQHLREQIPVTLKSVYDKLQNIETRVSAGLVCHVSNRC